MDITNAIKWDEKGLIPVVVQDYLSKDVLMLAYMNKEALELTVKTKTAHYFSRSRQKLWLKGETSGHTQKVKSIKIDCDNDTILIEVEQTIGACHTGYWSCFYRTWENGWNITGKKVFESEEVYKNKPK